MVEILKSQKHPRVSLVKNKIVTPERIAMNHARRVTNFFPIRARLYSFK